MNATIASSPHSAISPQHKYKHLNPPKAQEEITAALSDHDEASGEILPPFDYGQIADEDARAIAKQAAKRIHANLKATEKHFIDTGIALCKAKAALKHGAWENWLTAEFRWTKRTAQNYMAVAEKFGDDYPLVSYLPSPIIYRLASDKLDALRDTIVTRAGGDAPLDRAEVEKLISEASQKQAPTDVPDKTEQRRAAAAKAMDILRADLADFAGFVTIVGEAGREFTAALREAAAHG